MKKIVKNVEIFIVAALIMSACGGQPTASATQEHRDTKTPRPEMTREPTPTYLTELKLNAPIIDQKGNLQYQTIQGYVYQEKPFITKIISPDNAILMAFYFKEDVEAISLEDEFKSIVEKAQSDNDLTGFTTTEGTPRLVSGFQSVVYDATAKNRDIPVKGQIVISSPRPSAVFVAYLFAIGDGRWDKEGKSVFDMVLNSFSFIEPTPAPTITDCAVSTDNTYGYTVTNPIRIGSGNDPVERAKLYFKSLRGAQGEGITFDRNGNLGVGKFSLDIYYVTFQGGGTVKLYLDISAAENPMAPSGFSCIAPFEFSIRQ